MKGPRIDRTGKRYGMLVVLQEVEPRMTSGGIKRLRWECVCDCGRKTIVDSSSLCSNSHSCGCAHGVKHGGVGKVSYSRWSAIKARCYYVKHKDYPNYGGRGIEVCERWSEYLNFVEDMGEPPTKNHSIERRDTNGNYCKQNCYWATAKEQSRNQRRNHKITIGGVSLCISDWAEKMGVDRSLIKDRILYGWPEDHAVLTPKGVTLKYAKATELYISY